MNFVSVVTLCCLPVALSASLALSEDETPKKSNLRVGTFDSRLVAIAYVRSDQFKEHMKKLHAELKKAETEKNAKRAEELKAEGAALQEQIHKQGFSTWPVDEILETIDKDIPDIAKTAKVDVIVSKWDIVFQRPGLEFVDVTDLMVEPFHPTQETRVIMEGIKQKAPVPLADIKNHNRP